jgi:hypothetical protein
MSATRIGTPHRLLSLGERGKSYAADRSLGSELTQSI